MFTSLLTLLVLTVGGFALTYLLVIDANLLWRFCAGNIASSVVFSLFCALAASVFGFSAPAIFLSILLILSPLALFTKNDFRLRFQDDWNNALKQFENFDAAKVLHFAYYFFFLILFWFFFERAIMENADGIFTGSSHNIGDLPFHLGAIFSFSDGQNFPPENPSYAFAKFTYPFMADLIAAVPVKFGARVSDAMLAQNVLLAFSLLVILERFARKLTGNRLAGRLAPVLLFFSGGLGFFWFFNDAVHAPRGFFQYLFNLPFDYTIRPDTEVLRWCNSLTALFMTQRSLLLGAPLVLLVLDKLREFFFRCSPQAENGFENEKIRVPFRYSLSVFLAGTLAGTLPLVHSHSIVALFLICAGLFVFSPHRWREWFTFGAGVALVAVPELLWSMTGSATKLSHFFSWYIGWVVDGESASAFWWRNTGLFFPLLLLGIYFAYTTKSDDAEETLPHQPNARASKIKDWFFALGTRRAFFYLAVLTCFIFPNVAQLAPWKWDNIKILIYWFAASTPYAALAVARLWQKKNLFRAGAVVCLAVLTLAGALDVWRVASRAVNTEVFETDSVKTAERIREKTAPRALFLNAPVIASSVVLSGRRSLMRFGGHLWSYGIDYTAREAEVKKIYEGSDEADDLLKKYGVEYVIISPEERAFCEKVKIQLNEDYFRKFPVALEVGQYRVYKIQK